MSSQRPQEAEVARNGNARPGASNADFVQFYAASFPALRAQLTRQFPRQSGAAEDALQHACLKAVESTAEIHDLPRFVARVATNYLLDRTRFDRRFQPDDGTILSQLPDTPHDRSSEWEGDVARREACTERALETVGDPARAMILMKYKDGCNYEQIAAALGLSRGSIGTTLLRARRRVRELADACIGNGESSPSVGTS